MHILAAVLELRCMHNTDFSCGKRVSRLPFAVSLVKWALIPCTLHEEILALSMVIAHCVVISA